MKLYLLPTGGIFGSAMRENLPATVYIHPCDKPQCEVQIGKETYHATNGKLTLSVLTDGIHTVKVDGKPCEGLYVAHGQVRPVGVDFRELLPALSRIGAIEHRLDDLEERYKSTKTDYIF